MGFTFSIRLCKIRDVRETEYRDREENIMTGSIRRTRPTVALTEEYRTAYDALQKDKQALGIASLQQLANCFKAHYPDAISVQIQKEDRTGETHIVNLQGNDGEITEGVVSLFHLDTHRIYECVDAIFLIDDLENREAEFDLVSDMRIDSFGLTFTLSLV